MSSRQKMAWDWAVRNFGQVATRRLERAARVIEEAAELVQALGLPQEDVEKIVRRAYSRPVGEATQEMAGLAVTLDILAENEGHNINQLALDELNRILCLPKDHWLRKHDEKVKDGVSSW